MIRSVMEGVAYNTRWLMGGVESFIGRPFDGLRFIGGGARSALWCQIFADVLDRPIDQVADPLSANVRGAAFVAAASIGSISSSGSAGAAAAAAAAAASASGAASGAAAGADVSTWLPASAASGAGAAAAAAAGSAAAVGGDEMLPAASA